MDDLIGHTEVVELLRRALRDERVAHAYLITGPRGVGRRTLALALARGLNCLAERDQRPCGHCRPCRLIQRGAHVDVRVVRRAPDRKWILLRAPSGAGSPQDGVADNIEFIQSDAQLRPADGRKKVYVILNAEELQPEAANRLLKTLEEPTAYVHFVLTASDRGAVLPTIVSRCQELALRPVPRGVLAAELERRGLADRQHAQRLAAAAAGRPGVALAAARDPTLLATRAADIDLLRDAVAADRLHRLVIARSIAERWASQADRVRATLRTWADWWRDVLLLQLGLTEHATLAEGAELHAAADAARACSLDEARAGARLVLQTLDDLEANVNHRLALDLLLLRLPRLQLPASAAAGGGQESAA